ncbi:MAG TPA: chemotaxis protein CheB [Dyella sp.]|uniref:chemotaxis protein CheB n=1 Tax=Dyella sp. TaxID=1869338 RepID=UPI002F93F99D
MSEPRAIVIGCSAGGLNALERLLAELDTALPATVIICAHTGSSDVELLCELLSRHSRLPVIEAAEREPAHVGVVQVAPSGYHLLVEHDARFALSVDPKVNFCRPSIDVLFTSAADAYRDTLIGVLLTGANQDGARGLADIRRQGGVAIVQDPGDAEVATMPQAGLDIAGADYCVPLNDLAPLLNRLCIR